MLPVADPRAGASRDWGWIPSRKGHGLTKEDIVNRVWNHPELARLTKKQAGDVIDTILDCIKDTLSAGQKLKFGGFGVFEVKHRKARMGRNPKTGQDAQIRAGRTVKFKPGKPFKQAVAGSND